MSALRTSLQTRESNLIVRRGDPAVELAKLAKEVDADCVLAHEEVCAEELQVERDLRNRMKEQRLETEIKTFWGNTLVHIDDLPFNPSDLPNTFTSFRKQVSAGRLFDFCRHGAAVGNDVVPFKSSHGLDIPHTKRLPFSLS